MIISAHTRRQLSSTEVEAEIRALLDGEATGTISDYAAVTIAAGWQSPGTTGRAFASLASTGEADATELLDNITAATREVGSGDRYALLELMALFAWVTVRMADHDND